MTMGAPLGAPIVTRRRDGRAAPVPESALLRAHIVHWVETVAMCGQCVVAAAVLAEAADRW